MAKNRSKESEKILLALEEAQDRDSLRKSLEDVNYSVEIAGDCTLAREKIEEFAFDLFVCDLDLPSANQFSLLKEIKDNGREVTTIALSSCADSETALEAIRLGACDYLKKPFSPEDLLLAIKKAEERNRLQTENKILREQVSRRYSFENIVAKSQSMVEIFETIKKISNYKTSVMLYGESGTGKELVARAIWQNSTRKNKRFIAINCGAIPENLLESELFGHKKGAFTDATKDKKGLFEEAEGGTIFLDEIGELPLHLQVKLLRVLQENEIRRVGDGRVIPIDVRIIAATLRDLEQDILDGRFRDDLFYRLNVITIKIPQLKERKEDIPLLVNHFTKKHREKLGLNVYGVSKDALKLLMEYDWPGNIRELENCIERAMILTDSHEITVESLPNSAKSELANKDSLSLELEDSLSIKHHMRLIEEHLIRKALKHTASNRTQAAKLLEISHRTLLYKIKEYRIEEP